MHSLRELRSDNTARQTRTAAPGARDLMPEVIDSNSRTTEGSLAANFRPGRELTPLVSAAPSSRHNSSPQLAVATRNGLERGDTMESRGRTRRNKDQEKDDEEQKPVSGRSLTITGNPNDSTSSSTVSNEIGVDRGDRRSDGERDSVIYTNIIRGAPPREKPKKQLTPLSARRSRMERQKRDEEACRMRYSLHASPKGNIALVPRGDQEKEKEHNPDESKQSYVDGHEKREEIGAGSRIRNRGSGIVVRVPRAENVLHDQKIQDEQDPLISEEKLVTQDSEGHRLTTKPGSADAGDEEGRAGDPEIARESRLSIMRDRMKKMGETLKSNGGRDGDKERSQASIDTPSDKSCGRTPRSPEKSDASSGNASEAMGKAEADDTEDDESDGYSPEQRGAWGREKHIGEARHSSDINVTLGHVVDRKMREMGYIRKPAIDELSNRRFLRDRVAAEGTPEVHFIGEILGAEGFGSGVSCRYRIEGGRHWTCLAGLEEGQTHVMYMDGGEPFAAWNHPVDLHYTTKSIQGWPRLMVQVWQLDMHGRNILRGYGFRHLPSTPGFSEISVPCWRPTGTTQEETAAFFLGVTPRLTAEDAVFNRAWDQRCRLVTVPAGTVWVQINGIFCNFHEQDVDSFLVD